MYIRPSSPCRMASTHSDRWRWIGAVVVLLAAATCCVADESPQRGARLFYRAVGADSNAPILPKTRSAWTQDRGLRTSNTGMANEGYTEFPFCWGRMDFTFVEDAAYYPRFVSGAQADESRVNTADMVLRHVYEPDGCVWGAEAREFTQTFVATESELVSLTMLIASAPGRFEATLLEGGPGGKPIGPPRPFESGHSTQWGTARWKAGQAPLEVGGTYAMRIRRSDGQRFKPYLHSAGDAYAGGMLYIDGQPQSGSDLAAWIVEQPADLPRAIIERADEDGWVYRTPEVWFRPRSSNVRMIWLNVTPLTMEPPTEYNCCHLVIYVHDEKGALVAGPKRSLSCGPVGGEHNAPFVFAEGEFPVESGKRYRVSAIAIERKSELPANWQSLVVARDMQLRVYGEPEGPSTAAIYNLTANVEQEGKLQLSWSTTRPTDVRLAIRGDGMQGVEPGVKLAHVDVDASESSVTVSAWAGHTYDFDLIAGVHSARPWTTPTYQIRMPRKDDVTALVTAEKPEPGTLLRLAPPRIAQGVAEGPLRYVQEIPLENGGFEDALAHWVPSDESLHAPDVGIEGDAALKQRGIHARWGDRMAGFTHLAGQRREQVFAESTLSRKIDTKPGHVYALCASAQTSVENGPRGDTRVRLWADPTGGEQSSHPNSTQWYWTDGKWMRIVHRFRAEADRATIGIGFFRWRDLDRASAYVDEVHVYDLGPSPVEPDAPPRIDGERAGLALVDEKFDVDDRVEGFLQAPPGFVITGFGTRAHADNVTTVWLKVQPLLSDGTLGPAEQLRGGWEPDSHLEAKVELPEGYVATGFGAGIAPEWDVKRLGIWARPLLPDGTLGEEELFRGGIDRQSGFEKSMHAGPGRVLTAIGMNCMFNDVDRIRVRTAELQATAEFEAGVKARRPAATP